MSSQPLIFGILNVTPDSFSDGGLWENPDVAVEHARAMVADGADVIDVGGESTRPGATPIDADEEQRRVLPVVRALADEGIVVSIDTMRASTATAAVSLGATYVNDVSGTIRPRHGDRGDALSRCLHRDALARGQHGHGGPGCLRRRHA